MYFSPMMLLIFALVNSLSASSTTACLSLNSDVTVTLKPGPAHCEQQIKTQRISSRRHAVLSLNIQHSSLQVKWTCLKLNYRNKRQAETHKHTLRQYCVEMSASCRCHCVKMLLHWMMAESDLQDVHELN